MSLLHQFVKHAGDLPLWVRIPGAPFSAPLPGTRRERLPGTKGWIDTSIIENAQKRLDEGASVDEIAQAAADRPADNAMVRGALFGGTAGGLAGRLAGGEAVTQPFKDVWEKGLSRESLRGLKRVPTAARLAPVAGLLAGVGISRKQWKDDAPERSSQALDAAKGLLEEKIIRQGQLNDVIGREGQKR